MIDFDASSIVPSTRDLLQVLSTRRKSLAVVALIGPEKPAEDAARLVDQNVSAFAFAEPGSAMQLGARASKTVPSLCLMPIEDKDGNLAARYWGADGVCIGIDQPEGEWDRLAKGARTMRMLPIASARDAEGFEAAVKAGARAILVRVASAEAFIEATKNAPRNVTIVAEIEGADADALRALVGKADAVIVPHAIHLSTGFESFVSEVDP